MNFQIWFVFCTGCMVRTNLYANPCMNHDIYNLIVYFTISVMLIESSHLITHLQKSRKGTIKTWISIARLMNHTIHAIYGKCFYVYIKETLNVRRQYVIGCKHFPRPSASKAINIPTSMQTVCDGVCVPFCRWIYDNFTQKFFIWTCFR